MFFGDKYSTVTERLPILPTSIIQPNLVYQLKVPAAGPPSFESLLLLQNFIRDYQRQTILSTFRPPA